MYSCCFLKTTEFNVGISSVKKVRITSTFSVYSMFLYNLEYEKENLLIISIISCIIDCAKTKTHYSSPCLGHFLGLFYYSQYGLTNNGTAYFS